MRVFLLAATALIGLSVLPVQAAPASGSDSDSALMVQPSTDNAKYQDKKKKQDQKQDEAKTAPDNSQPTAEEPNVMPQDQDKQQTQPIPGQEPSPRPH